MRRWGAAVLLLCAAAAAHQPSYFYAGVDEPDGSVLVDWESGRETLVVDFGCLLLLPASPEVERSTVGFFPSLRHLTRPRLHLGYRYERALGTIGYLFLGAALLSLVILGSRVGYARAAAGAVALLLLAGAVGAGADDSQDVVVEHGSGALERLAIRGFPVPAHAVEAARTSLDRGWYVVGYRAGPRPLVFRFEAESPLLAVPFGLDPETKRVDVYGASGRAAARLPVEFSESIPRLHPEVARLCGESERWTRSRGALAGGSHAWVPTGLFAQERWTEWAVQRFLQLALLGASLLGFSVWLVIAACGAWSPGQRLGTCAGFVLGVPAVVFILAPEMPVVEPIIVEYSRSHGMDWRRQEALEALFRKSGRSFEGLRAAAAKAGYVEFDGPGGFTLRKGENGPELVEYDYFTLREWGAPTIGGN